MQLEVNGQAHTFDAQPDTPLLCLMDAGNAGIDQLAAKAE